MKFKGEPNLFVRINKPHHGEAKHFFFDDNGHYETEHPMTIKRLQATFEEVKEEPKIEIYSCKKCDFTTDNKGYLMQHYKNNHKKEIK